MIDLSYRSHAVEITHAALLYVQYHLSSRYWIATSWLLGIGTLYSLPVYWSSRHLNAYLVLLHLLTILFVFGRYRLYTQMIRRNMQRHPIHDKDIRLTIHEQGLTYTADSHALNDGTANWSEVSSVLQTANGYIFILSKGHFLWLPSSAIPTDAIREKISAYLKEKQISLAYHPEWSC